MKTFRLSLVSLLALLMLSASTPSVWPQCSSSNTGVLGWWPKFFEDDTCGCTVEGMIDNLLGGAARLDANAVYYAHDDLNKPPEPLTTLANEAPSRRTLFIKTHGYAYGFAAVYYKDADSRDAAYAQLVQAGWVDNYHVYKDPGPPAPSIYVTNDGIREKIAGSMDPQRIIGAFYCFSYPRAMSSWGVGANGPGTFYGYDYVLDCDASCEVVRTIIARMGCYSFPFYGQQTDDAARGMENLVTLSGNRKNQYNCGKSCWNWDVRFLDAHADRASGTINWAVRGEDAETRYLVRGYPAPDADPEVLLTVDGQGRDGYGVVSTYTVPMEDRRFEYFDVVEIDGAGRRTPSDLFTWGAKPDRWEALVAMNGKPIETLLQRSHEPASLVECVAESGLRGQVRPSEEMPAPPPDSACADVVIYSPVRDYIVPVAQHYWRYSTEQGFGLRTRSFVGSTDPLDARAVLQEVIAANEAYMEQCQPDCSREYPLRPILQIVGHTMGHMTFPDDPWGSCQQSSCFSYNMIYDIDGDGYPDGPIAVLPCDSLSQLQRYVTAVDDWNNNRFVDPDGTLQVLVGDRVQDSVSPELPEDMAEIADSYEWWGNDVAPALLESGYGRYDYQEMREAFYAAMNEGRRDVWAQGFSTDVSDLTVFISGLDFDAGRLTRKQRVMVFAPTCRSAEIQNFWPHQCRELLFNDAEKTVAAGFVGLLNAAYEGHDYARTVLLDELSSVWGQRKPLAWILDQAVQALRTQFPDYGRGLTFFGAYALSAGDGSTTGVPSNDGSELKLALWSSRVTGEILLHFSLPQAAHVRLNIYDAAGRRVSSICDDQLGSGVYSYSWGTTSTPSGIYFARIEGGSMAASQKLLVVQ